MAVVRLQKVLARAGLASRRAAEHWIAAGRVEVDGQVVRELGTSVDPTRQSVRVDGRVITDQTATYLLLHKPRAVVSTLRDPQGRRTVADLVRDVGARVAPVGRLDYDTSGVLLLTNDGDLAAKLSHPRWGTAKTYVAKVQGMLGEADLERWRERIEIDGKLTQPAQVRLLRKEGGKSWLEIVLHEGKNRQIHRLGEHTGCGVLRLSRVAFAGLTVGDLRPGEWRHLSPTEVAGLKRTRGDAVASQPRTTPSSHAKPRRANGLKRRRAG